MPFLMVPGTRLSATDLSALEVVFTYGSQTVTGLKTFTTLPRSSINPTNNDELTRKGYVDALVASIPTSIDWQDSVLDKDLTTPPPSPAVGDRYIVWSPAGGAWSGHDYDIAEWNGSSWVFIDPSEGMACEVEDEDLVYAYNSSLGGWVPYGQLIQHGTLQGLGADDHVQYALVNGTRAFTGNVSLSNFDLESVGNVRLPATTSTLGSIYVGGSRYLHNYAGTTALGVLAGNDTMTGAENTLIGQQAGLSLTTGLQNVILGAKAGDGTATGSYSVIVGAYAGSGAFTGDYNTFIGCGTAYAFSTGNHNTACGAGAMAYASGSYNTAIGYWAGRVANGDYNVYLGYMAGRSATGSHKLYIANSSIDPPLIYGEFNNKKVGINTTNVPATLSVEGQGAYGGMQQVLRVLNTGGGDFVDAVFGYNQTTSGGENLNARPPGSTGVRGQLVGGPACRIGVFGYIEYSGANSGYNIGVMGATYGATEPNKIKYGVWGISGPGSLSYGGFFEVESGGTAALCANNRDTSADIFLCRDNGLAVFRVSDGGNVCVGGAVATSKLVLEGSLAVPCSIFSVDVSLGNNHSVVLVDASGGARTITLPLASSCPGRTYTVKKVDSSANTVTVQRSGTDTIDGAASYTLVAQYNFVTLVNNSSNWWVIAVG